jgi:transposase
MNKKYTQEFKEEAIKLITEQGYSQAEVSRNLGVSDTSVNRWLLEHLSGKSKKSHLEENEQEELKRLRKENNQLKMEREILKKAAAFFASESK